MLDYNSIEEFKNRMDYAPRKHAIENQTLEIVEIDRKAASQIENSDEDIELIFSGLDLFISIGLKLTKLLLEAI